MPPHFGRFLADLCDCAYQNMPVLTVIRMSVVTFHESVLDFTYSSLLK